VKSFPYFDENDAQLFPEQLKIDKKKFKNIRGSPLDPAGGGLQRPQTPSCI